MLVDDHSIVRMGLLALMSLDPEIEVIAEAEDGEQSIELFAKHQPSVVLMDVRMPGIGGVAAVQQIKSTWKSARILMLTTSDLEDDIHRAIEAGAEGYVLKSATREELTTAIKCLHRGECYIPSAIAHRLNNWGKRSHLSQREIEVLDFLRQGYSNKDVGVALGISEHTAKAHVKSILQKLESADRTEAVTRGFELGLLKLTDS